MKEADNFEQEEVLQTDFAIYFKQLLIFDKQMFTEKFYPTRKHFNRYFFVKQYSSAKIIFRAL